MEDKRFKKNDEGFVCTFCGKTVEPLGVSSRDHCPHCLHSRHVDINPGDRANACGGELVPVRTEPNPKKGFIIVYRCKKCGETVRCRAALRGNCPDDTDLLIRLTAGEI